LTGAIALAVGLLAGLGLAACGSDEPDDPATSDTPVALPSARPSATPTPTPTPEAVASADTSPTPDPSEAAVTDAVAAYYRVYNQLAQNADADIALITTVALEPQIERATTQLQAQRDAGQRQIGDIQPNVEVVLPISGSATTFLADVCVDTRTVDVVDADGNSLMSGDSMRQVYAAIYVEQAGGSYLVMDVQYTMDVCGQDQPS
jgi:hypothetical protein